MDTLIWSFAETKELNKKTGFVICDSKLAAQLVLEGKAQDPLVGANHLKEIGSDLPEIKKKTPEKKAR